MAGRLSELPALAEPIAAGDVFEMLNVSDTSNNATGENVGVDAGSLILPQMHLMLWNLGVR